MSPTETDIFFDRGVSKKADACGFFGFLLWLHTAIGLGIRDCCGCIRCALWSRNGCDLVEPCQRTHYLLLNIILIIADALSTMHIVMIWTRKISVQLNS